MRHLLLLVLLAGCPAPSATLPDAATLDEVRDATRAWTDNPSPETLERAAKAAGLALERPVGDRSYDVELARILNDVLLRPDLARPRLAPHAASLTGDDAEVWLDILLRSNDLPTFCDEVARLHGERLSPKQPALMAAAAQAGKFREVDADHARFAHRAATFVEQLPSRGRKTLDLPFTDFPDAVELLVRLLPDHKLTLATARTTRQDEPVPALDPGAIPAMDARRRVIGMVSTPDLDGLRDLAARAAHPDNQATVSFVMLLEKPDTDPVLLCGEGRMEGEVYWGISACEPFAQARWMDAAAYFTDLKRAGASPTEATARVRERFPAAPFGE
jgi:phosphoglycolate phosphatase-like HAD superfamily hydrolase